VRVLITGASGSGTTTLGRALAQRLGASFFDADDYFWLPTSPPFKTKRDEESRLRLLSADLREAGLAVVAGSIMNWGAELEDGFTLIVFLTLDAEIRVARLRVRELALLGRIDAEFLDWARQYDEGRLPGRSRARHERWLSERHCPVLRLDGDLATAERVDQVIEALSNKTMEPTR
jgi:uridine kinase